MDWSSSSCRSSGGLWGGVVPACSARDCVPGLSCRSGSREVVGVERAKAPESRRVEVASKNTWREDLGRKRALYAQLGVREYWLFDPKEEYFDPELQGLGLRGRAYRPLLARVENGARVIRSEVLGLDLRVENQTLRFRDFATGEQLRSHAEATTAVANATTGLAEEKVARRIAEARIAELEARLREP